MSRWITIGSDEDIKIKERNSLNAYMFWIGTDCYSIKPAEAFKKFTRELWYANSPRWINTIILTQDTEGLTAMREEYTKQTGKDWKTAHLQDVMNTLHYCKDLYAQGKVLINGKPNLSAIFANEDIDISPNNK